MSEIKKNYKLSDEELGYVVGGADHLGVNAVWLGYGGSSQVTGAWVNYSYFYKDGFVFKCGYKNAQDKDLTSGVTDPYSRTKLGAATLTGGTLTLGDGIDSTERAQLNQMGSKQFNIV